MKRWPIIASVLAAVVLSACGTTSVFDLKKGDCFNQPDDEVVTGVASVKCDEPHDYEIYGAVNHPGGDDAAYPGESAVAAVVDTECGALFEPFVGTSYEASELYIYYLAPTAESWDNGDREILCALYLPGEDPDSIEPLTGSQEGSNR